LNIVPPSLLLFHRLREREIFIIKEERKSLRKRNLSFRYERLIGRRIFIINIRKSFGKKKKDNRRGLELKFNVAILQYVCLSDHAAFYVGV
jgi:hypothetical protein